jgi:flavin reductase (DIM6/NTAB) family NADH-FMN oxidoreductase RutF
MGKTKMHSKIPAYPMPVALVGAQVKDKPNFLTVAWFSMVNFKPPHIMVVLNKGHYTNQGIFENKTFSVNIPSEDMISMTDYCSTVSGRDADKSTLFKTFYGVLKNAPLIEECPVASECRLTSTTELPTHDIFIGEIVETYVNTESLSNGIPDLSKVKPIVYTLYGNQYRAIGRTIGEAMHIGKTYRTTD